MRALLLLLVLAAGCSRKAALNYRHCLKLRIGMTTEQLLAVMGPADEISPYVEGKSLPHLKGRTAYEWANAASMPAPNIVSVDESGKAASIRCGDSVVTAAVYIEPPAPAVSTAPVQYGVQAAPAPAPAPARRAGPRESGTTRASGKPLTE